MDFEIDAAGRLYHVSQRYSFIKSSSDSMNHQIYRGRPTICPQSLKDSIPWMNSTRNRKLFFGTSASFLPGIKPRTEIFVRRDQLGSFTACAAC